MNTQDTTKTPRALSFHEACRLASISHPVTIHHPDGNKTTGVIALTTSGKMRCAKTSPICGFFLVHSSATFSH